MFSQMTFSLYSLAGLLIMLGIGLLDFGLYQRLIYPAIRARHEKAKVTGTHGRDPRQLSLIIKIVSLIILPVLGFIFGDPLLSGFFG